MAARSKRRDATKQETRQALLEAGLAEVVERGLDVPSLDSICARAGFTRGAFYVHFDNREDFLVQLMDWVVGRFLDTIVSDEGGDGSLEDIVRRFMEVLGQGSLPLSQLGMRISQLLEATERLPQIRGRFLGLMHEAIERVSKRALDGQQAGRTRTDIDADSLATLLVSLAVGGIALHDAGLWLDLRPLREAVLRLLKSR